MTIPVMVEIPKGSRNKYEYDLKRGVLKFDRMLFSAVHYPSDYGFIPETLASDGDPLDALVLVWEPTFPGCMIEARPIGPACGRSGLEGKDSVSWVPLATGVVLSTNAVEVVKCLSSNIVQ